jgi:hypothetical protein
MTRSEAVQEMCNRLQQAGLKELDHRALIESVVTMLYGLDAALDEATRAAGVGVPYSVQHYLEKGTA